VRGLGFAYYFIIIDHPNLVWVLYQLINTVFFCWNKLNFSVNSTYIIRCTGTGGLDYEGLRNRVSGKMGEKI